MLISFKEINKILLIKNIISSSHIGAHEYKKLEF